MTRLVLALAPALLLGGCISFGGKPPKLLMALSTTSAVPANASRQASATNTILVQTPTAPVTIMTPRIPVYDGATSLAYVADAAWNEPPARAFQRILSETVTAKTDRVVLDPRQFGPTVALRLSGQLQRFGIDARSSEAVVVFDAQLVRDSGAIETRRFESRVSVGAIAGARAGNALNRAANDIAGQVADWVK